MGAVPSHRHTWGARAQSESDKVRCIFHYDHFFNSASAITFDSDCAFTVFNRLRPRSNPCSVRCSGFVNYSIGYFIFLSSIFIAKNLVNKNVFLILFLISYEFSVYYLEPYSLMFQNLNPFIFISIIFYLLFIYLEFFKNNLEPNNYSESTPNVTH